MRFPPFVKYAALFSLAAVAAHAQERVIALPLAGPAYELASEAYAAYERADYARAAEKAREAVRLRPDVPELRTLLDRAEKARKQALPAATKAAPAYRAAAAAYQSLSRKRFEEAARHAAAAVRLEPGKLEYRLLLVDALHGAGRLQDAEQALADAIGRVPDPEGKLPARQAQWRLQRASQPMTAYYRAMQAGDKPAALAAIREAAALVPDLPAYRLILVASLIDNGQAEQAQAEADEAVAKAPSDHVAMALRAAVRQWRGDTAGAAADFDQALALAGMDAGTARSVRLIAADAAMAAGERERALALLAPLDDDAALARLRSARVLPAQGGIPLPQLFAFPELNCRTAAYGQVCSLVPGVAPDLAYVAASEGYRALALRDYRRAADRAKLAHAAMPDNRAYRLLLVRALLGMGDAAAAERIASDALARDADDADLLLARGEARQQLSKTAQAREDFRAALRSGRLAARDEVSALSALGETAQARQRLQQALAQGELSRLSDIEMAYLANQAGDDDLAYAYFQSADRKGALPDKSLPDAAYAAMRSEQPREAVPYFRRAVDAAGDAQDALAPRREIAQLERNWGMFAGVTYRGTGALAGELGQVTRDDTMVAGTEFYWRPFGYQRNGQVELFARAFEFAYNKDDVAPSGAPTLQASVGARIKPFASQSFFLSVSKLVPVGSRTISDWLAQASYFAGTGVDLEPARDSWTTAQLSAEAGRYFHYSRNYALASVQLGRSYRLSGKMANVVVNPYLVVAGEHDPDADRRNAVGAGPGVTFRYWFNEDRYAAHRSYADFTIQYRKRVGGDSRARGPYVSFSVSY